MPTIKDVIVRKPSEQEAVQCQSWPIWSCGPSEFDWEYTQTEKCFVLEGQVEVKDAADPAQSVTFGPGDYVQFPDGLKCIWKVTAPVKKHYDFE